MRISDWSSDVCSSDLTFFQGVTLGAYMHGLPVVDRGYAGGAFDWISPFAIFTGLGLIVAYALLGCTWLILKTHNQLHDRMREQIGRESCRERVGQDV